MHQNIRRFFTFFTLAVFLTSCKSSIPLFSGQVDESVFKVSDAEVAEKGVENAPAIVPKEMIRVGVLAPLTGSSASLGESLKNSALMSLFDVSSQRLILQFYDTQGTAEGARNAANLAISQGAELLIGPVFSSEVKAVASTARSEDVSVIAFSSDPRNLGDGIYTISTLASQQVDNIVRYACDKGYKKLAIISQDSMTGDIISMAAKAAVDSCGAMITKAAFYNPRSQNFQEAIKSIVPTLLEDLETAKEDEIKRMEESMPFAEEGKPVMVRKDVMELPLIEWTPEPTEEEKAALVAENETLAEPVEAKAETEEEEEEEPLTIEFLGKEAPEMVEVTLTPVELQHRIETLKTVVIERDPFEFDAILISEEGTNLRSLAAMLLYYDVPAEVKVLGTSQWADSKPARERSLIGGWFSHLPSEGFITFNERYRGLYGKKAPRIASQAYDAVALAAILAESGEFSEESLTTVSGFNGVDGLFRLLPNGLSERGLQILGVEKKGFVTLLPAEQVFETMPVYSPEVYVDDFRHSEDLVTKILTPEEIEALEKEQAEEDGALIKEEDNTDTVSNATVSTLNQQAAAQRVQQ